MLKVELRVDVRIPRRRVPAGEAGNVHRGGGRYISILGSNELFHNPKDQGSEAVDLKLIERFATAVATVAESLASA
jgi:hypothetical protein